ncbi:MAG: cobalamin-dependent protein, partial [Bacteroidota bacterium]|nr:cobalamin-dependent protein [Bacteroidota bacterium]
MNHSKQRLRIITATSLFDGHDAAINIMRRILQSKGVEVIHLGHNRSVHEIAEAAIEEDVQAVAITSYQGGHMEFFKYLRELLDESGCGHIRIFGGGGGTILPVEIKLLQENGITRIYSPDDGRAMGLEGMIDNLIQETEKTFVSETGIFWSSEKNWNGKLPLGAFKEIRRIARSITHAENSEPPSVSRQPLDNPQPFPVISQAAMANRQPPAASPVKPPIIGITGTGGAGKSSVTDEIVRRFLQGFTEKTIAVISVDPSKKKTGGALLGDRIRMNSIHSPRAYMRSLATRETDVALSAYVQDALDICRNAAFDIILLESAGTGQSDASILNFCDVSVYVMTPEYGAASQLEKINMLDYADIVVINKSDKPGASDALIEVRKQYKRNHGLWNAKDTDLPVLATTASLFNDAGTQELFMRLLKVVDERSATHFLSGLHLPEIKGQTEKSIIPASRSRYLSEIHESIQEYNKLVEDQKAVASTLYKLSGALEEMKKENENPFLLGELENRIARFENLLTPVSRKLLKGWQDKIKSYQSDEHIYYVRNQEIRQA